jgi:addiction module HigA family antidote
VVGLDELSVPPGNRLEALSGARKGQFSIRINDQDRICFVWSEMGPAEVEIVDYQIGSDYAARKNMVRVPTHREPTHPGEMLLEEFLRPMEVTQRELADGIHVPYQRVNELVNQRRGITPSTALRLAKFLGTSPDFWMHLQQRWDLYHAAATEQAELRTIRRLRPAS